MIGPDFERRLSLKYSDFCAPFYSREHSMCGLKGLTAQKKIGEFFVRAALGERADELLIHSEDLYRKWFSGDRSISPDLWSEISDSFDEIGFTKSLVAKINDKALPRMFSEYGIELLKGNEPDKYIFVTALTEQFKVICDGCGEGDSVIVKAYDSASVPEDFPEYAEKSYGKFSKLKTLLYSNEEHPFDEFFVCNTIRTEEYFFRRRITNADKVIENVTLDKLLEKARYCLIVGMGGIGKSMMMRHLFLESIQQYCKTGELPVMVILREFGVESNDLFDLIVRSIKRFDSTIDKNVVNKMLLQGKCQLLLDGLDEIKMKDMNDFLSQLDYFTDQYPNNQIVISTRRFSTFVGLSKYRVLWMERFSQEQALELIDKLKYHEEEIRLKERFKQRLKTDLFKTHAEFATNPLLLTLMYMNFRIFTDVPEKQHKFYKQAYETLLQKHDGDKLTLTRSFHSVKDTSDFTDVFAEFCARSYRKGDYEFDEGLFKYYFGILHSTKKMDPSLMKVDNFKFDALHSSCLMYEEAQRIHFLHRSFQEYFFAEYYSRQDDTTMIKLGRSLRKPMQTRYDESEAFNMLYELASDKVERFIFLPFLEEIYAQPDREKSYWTFLKEGFHDISYTIFDFDIINKHYKGYQIDGSRDLINLPSTVIMIKMLMILGIQMEFIKDYNGEPVDYQEFAISTYIGQTLPRRRKDVNKLRIQAIPSRVFNDKSEYAASAIFDFADQDSLGNLLIFGHDYTVDISRIIDEPERYGRLKSLLEDDKSELKHMYLSMEKYYFELMERYKNSNDLDDDDF